MLKVATCPMMLINHEAPPSSLSKTAHDDIDKNHSIHLAAETFFRSKRRSSGNNLSTTTLFNAGPWEELRNSPNAKHSLQSRWLLLLRHEQLEGIKMGEALSPNDTDTGAADDRDNSPCLNQYHH